MNFLEVFVLFQMLDLLTTLVGLRLGADEGSLFIGWLMRCTNPLAAMMIAKFVGAVWGGVCLFRRKPFAIVLANYFFGGVILWNSWQIGTLLASARTV